MRKEFYKFFLLSVLLATVGIFSVTDIFAQGGADGLGGKVTPKTSPVKETGVKSGGRKAVPAPKSKPVSVVIKADAPGTAFKETLAGQTLVAAYDEEDRNLQFTIEATTDFTDNKSKSSHDSLAIYVDSNRNNEIDCKDVAYYADDQGEVSSEYFPMWCENKKFASGATLKYAFTGTAAESRPHPVWILKIPKSELVERSGIFNARFEYSDGSKSYGDCNGGDCTVRIPKYNFDSAAFGPVKKLKYSK